ncbi:MaoC family dehydratase N-terminal domain-containing protein [Amycolatopsis sp. NPDC049253]|uniref:FAS1-like dehydratase domain-containing protein n=1 Tax=Amycolatopsis sp. NPDC049253 TaxID=3155274 RepID=UPI00344A3682
MASTRLEFSTEITDEMLSEAAALEGQEIRVEPWNNEATLDTIRHYAWGLGDHNPLFHDEQYAAASPHGGVIAPPTFLYSSYDGAVGLGFPGVQPIYAGTEWVFHETIHRGDRILPKARLGKVTVHSGRHADRFAIQRVHTEYRRESDGVLLAEALASTFRVPRAAASGGLSYQARDKHVYRDEELEEIRRWATTEARRGTEPRTPAEVQVGDVVPEVVKGPIDQITMTAYYAGCIGSPGYKAGEISWLYRTWAVEEPERLPNNYDPTYFSERVLPSLGHQDPEVAKEIGMPGAYNNGPQKCGWMAHPVLNWMGDAGSLREFSVRLRRPDIFGDTVWCGGKVTEVRDNGDVLIALSARNQLGEQTAEGSALVRLS